MKIYISVHGSITVKRTRNTLFIEFQKHDGVQIGARSFHETPNTAIRTTSETDDIAAAISHLGSNIEKTSPLRSYPTYRRHPPLIKHADTFDIPNDLEKPATGIELHLPATKESLYSVAPLAFYLGATVVPLDDTSATPRLRTQNGFTYELDQDGRFDETVNRVLEQVFFLDCLARRGILYDWGLQAQDQIEPKLSFSMGSMATEDLSVRLEKYLGVPYGEIANATPTWPLTVDIEPVASQVELLPFIAYDLAHVRPVTEPEKYLVQKQSATLEVSGQSSFAYFGDETVDPGRVGTIEHAYAASYYPLNANSLTAEACEDAMGTKLTRSPQTKLIIVNNRDDNTDISESVNASNWINIEFRFAQNTTTEELRNLLLEPAGLFHYIGNVSEKGFQCSDGHLALDTIVEANATTFLLNGCQSLTEAKKLIEKGCYAGIASLGSESVEDASSFGIGLGKFLITGFSVRAAVNLVSEITDFSSPYSVLGDGGITVRQSNTSGCPTFMRIRPNNADTYQVEIRSFTGPGYQLGSTFLDKFTDESERRLNPTQIGPFVASAEELVDQLRLEVVPIDWQGEVYLSNEVLFSQLMASEMIA